MTTYTVKLSTPAGIAELDVPTTLGPEAAGRRAQGVAYAHRWADVGEAEIVSVTIATD